MYFKVTVFSNLCMFFLTVPFSVGDSNEHAELESIEIFEISLTASEIYAKEVNFFKTVNLGVKLVNIINSFLDTMFLSGTESCKYLE